MRAAGLHRVVPAMHVGIEAGEAIDDLDHAITTETRPVPDGAICAVDKKYRPPEGRRRSLTPWQTG